MCLIPTNPSALICFKKIFKKNDIQRLSVAKKRVNHILS